MRKSKPFTREQYLKKFSRAVRWRLGVVEAEEAISDYREMIYQEERDESKLVEELGDPGQAAYLLTDAKSYRRWLIVFAVLALMLVMCAQLVYMGRPVTMLVFDLEYRFGWRGIAAMVVGIPLSLFWFRRYGKKSGPLSGRLTISLVVVLIVGCGILVFTWYVMGLSLYTLESSSWVDGMLRETFSQNGAGYTLGTIMMCAGILFGIAGLIGLVMSRGDDRRWLALYILTLTFLAVLVVITGHLHAMDLTYLETSNMRATIFREIIPITVVGLIGTGVALC